MSSPEQMRALIARVEQASGPDRELDAEIGRGLGWEVWSYDDNDHIHAQIRSGCFQGAPSEHPDYVEGGGHVTWRYLIEGKPTVYGELPQWTGSLDAAASLVPSGHNWSLDMLCKDGNEARTFFGAHPHEIDTEATGATPALALTAAALRARLAMQEASDE